MKNILHISDIHSSNRADKGNSADKLKQITAAIVEDLALLPKVDTVIITGDIANSGDSAEYKLFKEVFLNQLLSKIDVNLNRVVIVPGNHDSKRAHWKNVNSLARENLCKHYLSENVDTQLKEYIADNFQPFAEFNEFRHEVINEGGLSPQTSNAIYCSYELDGVGIAAVNTAWLAFKDDRDQLMIGEHQLVELLRAIKSKKQKIILMHHPLDWLHCEDRALVSDLIYQSKISCLYFGHMHAFSIAKESRFDEDSVLRVQAGQLDLTEDGSTTGYTLMALNDENSFEDGVIYFRHWDKRRGKFEPWNNRAKDGRLAFSIKDAVPFNSELFFDICRRKKAFIDTDLLCNVGLPEKQWRRLTEVFVCPTLTADVTSMTNIDEKFLGNKVNADAEQITLDSIFGNSKSIVLLGSENSGKTTLAMRMAMYYLAQQAAGNLSQCFFYVNAKDGSLAKSNTIEKKLLDFYFADEDASSCQEKIRRKLKTNSAVILIDSCEALEPSSLKGILAYINNNPEPRYILCAQLSAKADLLGQLNSLECKKKFDVLTVAGLKRTHVRRLFEKWSPSSAEKNTFAVTQAIQSIAGAGMPSNPFVYTMLLSIKERKSTTFRNYIHEADLIENFIEVILEKHVFTANTDPQYKDLILFLGYCSSLMQGKESFALSESEMAQAVASFNHKITKNFSYLGYVTPLVRCGILRNGDGYYVFSQICFFNYALAHWFVKTGVNYPELEDSIKLIQFDKVYEYISAIKKNDLVLLEFLKSRVTSAWTALLEEEKVEGLTGLDEEIEKCASHDLLDILSLKEIENGVGGENRTQQEADDEMDRVSPLNSNAVSSVKKIDSAAIVPSIHFNELLSLYARAFRAADHVMDATVSATHFSAIFDFYMKSAARHVRYFDQNLRPVLIARLAKVLNFDKLDETSRTRANEQAHAFLNFAISAIPNWTVSMMNSDFFNQRQLERMKLFRQNCGSNLDRLLITYSLCEIEGVNVPGEITAQKYDKSHESTSLLIKTIELIYFNFAITKEDKKRLEEYVKKLLKDRKNKNMLTNHAAVSKRMLLDSQ